MQSLSLPHSRALHTGTGRSFAWATRTLLEIYRSIVADASLSLGLKDPSAFAMHRPVTALHGSPSACWEPSQMSEWWDADSSPRLEEEGTYG